MRALLIMLCCSIAFSVGAQVYKWTDSTGKVHYGDKPPEGTKTEQLKTDAVTSYEGTPQVDDWGAVIRRPTTVESLKPRPEATSKALTMYATSWCPYCKRARIYFEAKGIAYREVDIEASKENNAEYKQYGGKGVPLFIYREKRMRGFSEAGMDRFLASKP